MERQQIEKKYSFKLNIIGDALAHIVSQVEGKDYVYSSVETYSWQEINNVKFIAGPMYNMAIVQNEYENIPFCTNIRESELWKKQKIAMIFKNTYGYPKSTSVTLATQDTYMRIFGNSLFPYLQEYIEMLADYREKNNVEITRELAFKLAFNYCGIIFGLFDNDKEPNKQKKITL